MNHPILPHDMDLLTAGLAKTGIKLSAKQTATCAHPLHCHYINNPDGTLRWIWPASSRTASFLRFYHTGSRKAAVMGWAVRMFVKAGVGRSIGRRSATVFIDEQCAGKLATWKDWSLFTGTVGENRKLVALYENEKGTFFVKIPVSPAAERNMGNEVIGTKRMHGTGIVKPWSRVVNDVVVVQPDIYGSKGIVPAANIGNLPLRAMVEWAGSGLRPEMIRGSSWWRNIEERMDAIEQRGQMFSPVLLTRLRAIYDSIWKHTRVMMAESHGDMTPWNVRHDADKLYIIDWEMYASARPALYDIFHFIYQDNILIKRSPYQAIRTQVDTYLGLCGMKAFLEANNIDTGLAEKLYLLDVVSYYMNIYSRQASWHIQVNWLLQAWCEALGYVLQGEGQLQPRQALLQEMVHFLKDTRYVVLKLQQDDLSLLPATSDVDMCLDKAAAGRLYEWLCTHRSVAGVRSQQLSFMRRISLLLNDKSFLHVDCLWQLKRKGLVFMDAQELLSTARENAYGVRVPAPVADMKYTWLFHLLNGASVPARHVEKCLSDIGLQHDAEARDMPYNEALHQRMLCELRARPENTGISRILNAGTYALDALRRLMPRKGMFVTFSGVDGAGKSTIIDALGKRIEKELRSPVVVLRHRPSVLPILSAWRYGRKNAELRSVRSMPRTGSNGSSISSGLRFAYYYSDYLLGQFYVHLRYVWQGYTVLYDRYYFDLINDAKRSNIVIPEKLAKWLYRFLLKPDLNYFLFAPTGIILQRKRELDEDTINELTRKYIKLFGELRAIDTTHGYHTICNLDMAVTMDKIFANIQKQAACAI